VLACVEGKVLFYIFRAHWWCKQWFVVKINGDRSYFVQVSMPFLSDAVWWKSCTYSKRSVSVRGY
jgi:hypothetical protein